MDEPRFERMCLESTALAYGSECIPLVTITSAEYRELCGKAALWDEYRADVERWTGGEADA